MRDPSEYAHEIQVLTSQQFIYRRINHDERIISFNSDFTIGRGQAGCEVFWDLVKKDGNVVLKIFSHDHSLTCEATLASNGSWFGQWVIAEKMSISFVPVRNANSTLRGAIVQQGSGVHQKYLMITHERHLNYALRHDFSFWPLHGDVQVERSPVWNKIQLILAALRSGFEFVVWLDADTLISDMTVDFRTACSEFEHIGMSRHPDPWGPLDWHYNSGVMFVKNSCCSISFLNRVWDRGETYHGWPEQHRIMECYMESPSLIQPVSARWNSLVNVSPHSSPIVRAFHGLANRENLLKGELQKLDCQ